MKKSKAKAFTLIELLVCVAIIVILVVMLVRVLGGIGSTKDIENLTNLERHSGGPVVTYGGKVIVDEKGGPHETLCAFIEDEKLSIRDDVRVSGKGAGSGEDKTVMLNMESMDGKFKPHRLIMRLVGENIDFAWTALPGH